MSVQTEMNKKWSDKMCIRWYFKRDEGGGAASTVATSSGNGGSTTVDGVPSVQIWVNADLN